MALLLVTALCFQFISGSPANIVGVCLPPTLAWTAFLCQTKTRYIPLRTHGVTNDWSGIPMDNPTPEPLYVPLFTTLFTASQTGVDREGDGEDMAPYSWH